MTKRFLLISAGSAFRMSSQLLGCCEKVVYDRNKIFLISAETVFRPYRNGRYSATIDIRPPLIFGHHWYSATTDIRPKWPIFGRNRTVSAKIGFCWLCRTVLTERDWFNRSIAKWISPKWRIGLFLHNSHADTLHDISSLVYWVFFNFWSSLVFKRMFWLLYVCFGCFMFVSAAICLFRLIQGVSAKAPIQENFADTFSALVSAFGRTLGKRFVMLFTDTTCPHVRKFCPTYSCFVQDN